MTEKDPLPEVISEDFKKGWKARDEYLQDYKIAHNGTAGGLGFMLISGMLSLVLLILTVTAIFEGVGVILFFNLGYWIIWTGTVFLGLFGYWLNNLEARDSAKRKAIFKAKWG